MEREEGLVMDDWSRKERGGVGDIGHAIAKWEYLCTLG